LNKCNVILFKQKRRGEERIKKIKM